MQRSFICSAFSRSGAWEIHRGTKSILVAQMGSRSPGRAELRQCSGATQPSSCTTSALCVSVLVARAFSVPATVKNPRDTHLLGKTDELLRSTMLCRCDVCRHGKCKPKDAQAVEVTEVYWEVSGSLKPAMVLGEREPVILEAGTAHGKITLMTRAEVGGACLPGAAGMCLKLRVSVAKPGKVGAMARREPCAMVLESPCRTLISYVGRLCPAIAYGNLEPVALLFTPKPNTCYMPSGRHVPLSLEHTQQYNE